MQCESQEAKCVIAEPLVDRPFLLLDVRSKEDFDRAHLSFARSYPANRLSRAVNFETRHISTLFSAMIHIKYLINKKKYFSYREMLQYKNKLGKLIIIYDLDESISHTFATTLVQRGYTNLFMVSGGIRLAQVIICPSAFMK